MRWLIGWIGMMGMGATLHAAEVPVFFGTGGGEARGIYRSFFHTDSGKLTPAELVAEIGSPEFLTRHPDGTKLYAVARGPDGPCVAAYRIGSNATLQLLHTSRIGDGGNGGTHLAVHPSGKFLLTAQYSGGTVALFPLDGEGRPGAAVLTPHTGGSRVVKGRQDAPHPHWTGFSPDGRFALVPDLGLDGVVVYRVDADQPAITRHGFIESVPGGGPRHLRFSPDGKFIHLLNELTLSLTTYAWDAAAGTARLVGTVPTLTDEQKAGETFNSAAEVLAHPGGRFVYTSNRGHDSVTVFQVDDAGKAAVVQVQPIHGAFPRHIALAPGGNWLLAAGADSHTISVHRVNPTTGRLTYQTKGIIRVPAPICVLFGE
jgi:6-phosphogluconolactonase